MINQINSIDMTAGSRMSSHAAKGVGGEEKSFGDLLAQAVDKISELDKDSTAKQIAFARGENIELHEVAIAMEKASIAMELAMAVRNKIVEAYQEMMRMNV
jgi:flagellar hook-basal body complex protein FliE